MIYAAKSTEDKRGSISAQLADCRQAVSLEPGRVLEGEHIDEAVSAYRNNRGTGLAAAIDQATALARREGTSELWVQHSDRLARGDGKLARHVVEIALWAIKADVAVRSLQDPDTFRDLLYAVVTGQRNHEDSRRKGAAAEAGVRRSAQRGEWPGGVRLDGYRIVRSFDDRGRVVRTVEFDPVRKPVIDRVFALAKQGIGTRSIAADLNAHGWRTVHRSWKEPSRTFHGPHVLRTLNNARYGGLVIYKGEPLGIGDWPAYVSPTVFRRLAKERRGRARNNDNKNRKQHHPYLLTSLGVCALCGGRIWGRTTDERHGPGLSKRYVCDAHVNLRGCPAPRIDLEAVDRSIAARWETLITQPQAFASGWIATGGDDSSRDELKEAIRRAMTDHAADGVVDDLLGQLVIRQQQPRYEALTMAERNLILRGIFAGFSLRSTPSGIEVTPMQRQLPAAAAHRENVVRTNAPRDASDPYAPADETPDSTGRAPI